MWGISDAAMLARRRPPAAFETSQDLGTSRRQLTIEPYTTFPHLKRGAEWLQVARCRPARAPRHVRTGRKQTTAPWPTAIEGGNGSEAVLIRGKRRAADGWNEP